MRRALRPSVRGLHITAVMYLAPLLVLAMLACACSVACSAGADSSARGQQGTRDSARGDVALARTGRARDTSRASRIANASDSAIAIQGATQPEFRTRADSFSLVDAIRKGLKHPGWPVKTAPPLPGSILPNRRIVAFYGNPLSKRMGILGEIPYDQMLAKLDTVLAWWKSADPSLPVVPALHLIVSVAQAAPGKDGMHRQRSDPDLIEKIYGFARQKNAIMFLDIQTGWSTLQEEIANVQPFLQRPDVHLGIDPEFNMHGDREGRVPGSKIGSMTADDVNYAIDQLARLVSTYKLPPKVLVVHRFTRNMLRDANRIKLDPRVQVVINMDGWGAPWLKFDTYATCQATEPVQFTGFKLFFHNDTKRGDKLLSPVEVLALRPRPIYIQYQ